MKFLKHAFVILVILFSTQVQAALVEGRDYTLIDPPQPTSTGNKVEVLEFFFYGCSHCFHLHPHLSAWEKKMPKDVDLVFVPTVFNSSWEPMAYTYYALESLGKSHELHDALYNAWNDHIDLGDVKRISAFVSKHGVDAKQFEAAYSSFGINSKVMRSKQMTQTFNIRGTPTVIVDGKYKISSLTPEDTIRVLGELVEKARKEHKR